MRLNLISRCALFFSVTLFQLAAAQTDVREALFTRTRGFPAHRPVELHLQSPSQGQKSVTLAVVYSLLLPGMGHLYADNFSTGKFYLIGETGLWITYAGFRLRSSWLRGDARSFAAQHADADFDGKNDQFAVDIGNFNSLRDYNEAKLRNREDEKLYDASRAFCWQWDSDANRLAYKDLRIRGDEVLRNSQFVIAAMVLNRLIAAFSAVRSVADYNRASSLGESWRLDARVAGGLPTAHGIELTLTKNF
ncbi:MAG: hypothetical protein FJ217_03655 [Ignavibacteria bacterium]|nr:hypothetical protein [Ignavibacteria bacterium]